MKQSREKGIRINNISIVSRTKLLYHQNQILLYTILPTLYRIFGFTPFKLKNSHIG